MEIQQGQCDFDSHFIYLYSNHFFQYFPTVYINSSLFIQLFESEYDHFCDTIFMQSVV